MDLYAYKNKKGRINQPEPLPRRFVGLTNLELAVLGWFPVTIIESTPEDNQVLVHYAMAYADNAITATPIYRTLSDDEIAEAAATRLSERKAELATLRYEKETAGITVTGTEVKTDRLSQAMLTSAMVAVQVDPTRVIDWKGKKQWQKLNAAAIQAIGTAVVEHVQACFTREKELSEALETDIQTDITAGWPDVG